MNTKVKHTPAPWRMGYKDGEIWEDETTIWTGHRCIANTVAAGPQGALQYQPEATANARLIAAAPELLCALELIVSDILPEYLVDHPGSYRAINAALAAIAKAKGQ